jgi:RNA polymerase sigma-70 factor (ECF subfamily)
MLTTGTMASSDGELLQRAHRGDDEAFAQLVDRYKDRLVNYLASLVRNRERAEDLAQESFIRLYERGRGYRDQGQLQAYLFRIATNLLRSQERRAARWKRVRTLLFAPGDAVAPPGQEARLLRDEANDRVRKAIASLPLHYRAPLVLHEIDGWRYKEICEALDCEEGTVKSRIHRARKLLEQQLRPQPEATKA